MENHGILNWRSWSIVRKTQIFGTSTGASLTVAILVSLSRHTPSGLSTPLPIILISLQFSERCWCGLQYNSGGHSASNCHRIKVTH